jgi:chromosome partitioning protein
MTTVLAIANDKGGVGKTTLSVNIAAGLAIRERYYFPENPGKVLFVDLDPSGNGAMTLGFKDDAYKANPEESICTVLKANQPPSIQRLARTCAYHPNLKFIPTNRDAMRELAISDMSSLNNRDGRLLRALRPAMSQYKYIVIDTPPGSNHMFTNAVLSSTHVLIPVELDDYPLRGMSELLYQIKNLGEVYDRNFPILGIVPTRVRWTSMTEGYHQALVSAYGNLVFPVIREYNDLKVASGQHQDVFTTFPPRANADQALESSASITHDFAAVVNEIIHRLGEDRMPVSQQQRVSHG